MESMASVQTAVDFSAAAGTLSQLQLLHGERPDGGHTWNASEGYTT